MEKFIFDTRKQISIINLDMTQEYLSAAASKVEDICSKGNKVLFVGTKRSASKTIKEEASAIGLPYVNKRWLGGTLTNWKTIRGSIRRLQVIEEMISSGRIEKLIKKAIDKSQLYEESVDDFALKYAKLKNSPRRLSNAQIAESMYMSTRTLQRRLKDAKLKGRKIGKSTASRKTMSEAKWGKVVDLIDSCDI